MSWSFRLTEAAKAQHELRLGGACEPAHFRWRNICTVMISQRRLQVGITKVMFDVSWSQYSVYYRARIYIHLSVVHGSVVVILTV